MIKNKMLKIKSAVVSGLIAVTALAAPFSSVTPYSSTESFSLNAYAASNDNYAKLLQYSLYLYDANMCGSKVGETSQLTWRNDCHTSDEVDGGFHDAGDHAMFGLPQGYTASTLGWGFYEFRDAYDALGQTAHFKTISDYFSDFFKASTKLSGNSVSSICIQKGLGDTDHAYWGPPETQGDRGGCDWRSSGCGDIAAEYAASLALSYINFGDAEDLKYAKALYNYAKNNMSTSTGDCTGFYKSTSVTDDIAWAAGWLYLATKDETYKNDCAGNQVQYFGWVHSWNTVDLGAACVYAHITNDWSKVNTYLSGICTNPNSYYFLDKWGSARLNTTMQLCALAATKNSSADYSAWCQGQMDYILGNNPAKTCFVVGFSSNSAKNAHHRAASGYTSYEQFDMNGWDPNGNHMQPFSQYGSNSHTLVGALVGGPCDASGTYHDNMADYICNEVAIDYNAGFVGAAAGLYSIYGTGSLESNIPGVGSVSISTNTTTSTTTTTTNGNGNGNITTTTTTVPGISGKYETKLDKEIIYSNLPADDKMIGFTYESLGMNPYSTEKITKVEVNISTSKSSIGKWQGAFGSSTKEAPAYWIQSEDMEQTFSGNKGTITWEPSSADASIIQYGYGGELKFGTWWINCDQFVIDSIVIYTDALSSGNNNTTSKSTTTTTTTTTTTPKPSSNGKYELKVNDTYNRDNIKEMIGFLYADFGLTASSTEKIQKVEVKLSTTNGSLGKWQGAFGSSTSVAADEYWTQTADMEQMFSGNSGTITWNVDSATANIIQYGYGGELKFGVWWIDANQFTIDSVIIYTDAKAATTTTTTTTTTKTTTTTSSIDNIVYGDANGNNIVEVADAVFILQGIADPGNRNYKLSDKCKNSADVDRSGAVDTEDAMVIQMYKADLISSLPRR